MAIFLSFWWLNNIPSLWIQHLLCEISFLTAWSACLPFTLWFCYSCPDHDTEGYFPNSLVPPWIPEQFLYLETGARVFNGQFIHVALISGKGTEASLLAPPPHEQSQWSPHTCSFWLPSGVLGGFYVLTEALFVLRTKTLIFWCFNTWFLTVTPGSTVLVCFRSHHILRLPKWLVCFKDISCLLAPVKRVTYNWTKPIKDSLLATGSNSYLLSLRHDATWFGSTC